MTTIAATSLEGNLLRDGFSLVPHELAPTAIDELIGRYAEFTDNLPDPDIDTMDRMIRDQDNLDVLNFDLAFRGEWHKYLTNNPTFFAKPGGYTNRSIQHQALLQKRQLEKADDPKEFFHYHPSALSKLEIRHDLHQWGAIPEEVTQLHAAFKPVYSAARLATERAFAEVEDSHPGVAKIATREDLDGSPVRLIFYHEGQGQQLAAEHRDKSTLTLQVAESHHGLRGRRPTADERLGDWQMVERDNHEQGVLFVGDSFKRPGAFPDSPLTPLSHDVVLDERANDQRQLRGQNCARWAIIFFANSLCAGLSSKTALHGEA